MSNFKLSMEQSPELEELLKSRGSVIHVPAKKTFCKIGDDLNGVYYIAKGRTSHYIMSAEGTEKMLYTLSKGWFFGDTCCTLHKTTSLMSRANVDTTLYWITQETFETLLAENTMFRRAIMTNNALKTMTMRHEIENITFSSCKDRLTKLFCAAVDTSQLIDGSWYSLHVHYSHADLSVIIGSSRITITKTINELCEEGVIRLLNRRIQISASYLESADNHF